jgi:hypothetical protein
MSSKMTRRGGMMKKTSLNLPRRRVAFIARKPEEPR